MLSKFSQLTGRCQIIADKRTPRHEATLKIETSNSVPPSDQKTLANKIVEEIKNRIGMTFNEVVFVPSGTFEGKYKKSIVIT
jgi:hypothetical protein